MQMETCKPSDSCQAGNVTGHVFCPTVNLEQCTRVTDFGPTHRPIDSAITYREEAKRSAKGKGIDI